MNTFNSISEIITQYNNDKLIKLRHDDTVNF